MKTISIVQSSYLPWRGYFHLIQQADAFVFLDSVQYTRADWRNRNRIITFDRLHWLSVPVHGSRSKAVNQVQIDNELPWQRKHYQTICQYYQKAECFPELESWLHDIYLDSHWDNLSELNQYLVSWISGFLGYTTSFYQDTGFTVFNDKNLRLIEIVKALGGTVYLTGPSALAYLDIELFSSHGIEVKVMQYPEYPAYQQLWNSYDSRVSILDLLLHKGKASHLYITGNQQ